MSRLKRLLTTGFVVGLAALLPISVAPAAQAADAPAAAKAADYLDGAYSQAALDSITDVNDFYFGAGTAADAISALSAAGGHYDAVTRISTWLQTNAAAYVGTSPGRAGKVAIAAATLGVDPSTYFTGVDLVAVMNNSLDPTTGEYGTSPYGQSAQTQALAVLGLARNSQTVPQVAVDFLLSLQNTATNPLASPTPDDLFGYNSVAGGTLTGDSDGTAYALMALSLVPTATGVPAAITSASAALDSLQLAADGSWAAFSPVNTTGLAASALESTIYPSGDATAWMVGVQRPDGSLPDGIPDDPSIASSPTATIDGLLLLAGENYATAEFTDAAPVLPAPTTSPAASTAPTATANAVAVTAQGATDPSERLAATGFEPAVPLTSGLGAVGLGLALIWITRSTRRPAYARKH